MSPCEPWIQDFRFLDRNVFCPDLGFSLDVHKVFPVYSKGCCTGISGAYYEIQQLSQIT